MIVDADQAESTWGYLNPSTVELRTKHQSSNFKTDVNNDSNSRIVISISFTETGFN